MKKLVMDKDAKIASLEFKINWFEKKYGPYISEKGFRNFGNLFRKPTLQEWTILFMLIMGLFMAWAYNVDVAACREVLEDIDGICFDYCGGGVVTADRDLGFNLNFTAEDFIDGG